MKILQLYSQNVKRLRAVSIAPDPTEPVVIIGGANGAGKTSVLDSIAMALAGARAAPDVPIRRGEDEARVELDLGDLRVTLRLDRERRELVVTSADGERRPSPQGILDSLFSRVTFDPLQFAEDEPAKQVKTLRGMLPGLDFTVEDARRRTLYDERTRVGRELQSAAEQLTAIPVSVLQAPREEVSISALVAQKSKAAAQNQRRRDVLAEIDQLQERRREMLAAIEKLTARLDELQPYVPEAVDTGQLDADLAGAEETNRRVRQRATREKLSQVCRDLEAKRDKMTEDIESIDTAKAKAMASAPWPVPGLGFSEQGDGVTLNGLPFDQASAAEKLRVSLAIGAALNPKLRVLLIRDGSLLDDNSMRLVREFAREHDMQVWIERVGGADPGAIVIEDGEVRGQMDSIAGSDFDNPADFDTSV